MHGRGVRAQHDVAAKVEAVLGVERGMVLGEIQRVEIVVLGLGFGTDDAREAKLFEDVADLVDDLRDEMEAAAPLPASGHREIGAGERGGAALELELTRCDRRLKLMLQRVGRAAHAFAGVGIEARESLQDFCEGAGLAAQELGLELLEPAFIRLRNLFQTLPQRIQSC